MRKPLIETSSPLYLRRLAKEVNFKAATEHVYYSAFPGQSLAVWVRDARYSKGVLYIRTYQQGDPFEPWTPVTNINAFTDANGQQIVASREP